MATKLVATDGRVTVIEKKTGLEVRLYPVDAREACDRIGSHVWPEGSAMQSEASELAELKRKYAELQAQLDAKALSGGAAEKPAAAAPAPKGAAPQAPPKPDANASVTAPPKP